ncbi:TTN [Mytilus edulis]|uniref:TTN n=1 Tax=Mytilus edulis TaxID=6550 RepID=A0A8S3TS33_MYTED|nr:TTN [Mytilus edulis]
MTELVKKYSLETETETHEEAASNESIRHPNLKKYRPSFPAKRQGILVAPKKLDIVDCTDCSVTIVWFNDVPDECLSYELDHRPKGTNDWSTNTLLSEDVLEDKDGRRMYTLKNLLPQTYYEFKMRSVYKDTKSHFSESMTKQTLKLVTIEWFIAVPDECISYELDHRTKGTDDWSTVTFLSKDVLEGEDGRCMYTLQNLLPKTYYEFKMRSVYKDTKSHFSESMTKQTLKLETEIREQAASKEIKEVKYDIKAFPRLTLLLTRLNEFMDKEDTNVVQLPHIRFICDEQFAEVICGFPAADLQFMILGLIVLKNRILTTVGLLILYVLFSPMNLET